MLCVSVLTWVETFPCNSMCQTCGLCFVEGTAPQACGAMAAAKYKAQASDFKIACIRQEPCQASQTFDRNRQATSRNRPTTPHRPVGRYGAVHWRFVGDMLDCLDLARDVCSYFVVFGFFMLCCRRTRPTGLWGEGFCGGRGRRGRGRHVWGGSACNL